MKFFTVVFLLFALTACDSGKPAEGRKAYKKYLSQQIDSPENLVIYAENMYWIEDNKNVAFDIRYGSSSDSSSRKDVKITTTDKEGVILVDDKETPIEQAK